MRGINLDAEMTLYPTDMTPALDEDGNIVIVMTDIRGVTFGLSIGEASNATAIINMLARLVSMVSVPDDAREFLPQCPTPRDVFGGRRRP